MEMSPLTLIAGEVATLQTHTILSGSCDQNMLPKYSRSFIFMDKLPMTLIAGEVNT